MIASRVLQKLLRMNLHAEMLTNVLLQFVDDEVLEVLVLEELVQEVLVQEVPVQEFLVQAVLVQEVLELEVPAVPEVRSPILRLVLKLSNKDRMNVLPMQNALILLAHILVNVMMDILVMVNCVQILMNVQRHLVIRKVLKMIKITLHHGDKRGTR